jgi:FdhE protein
MPLKSVKIEDAIVNRLLSLARESPDLKDAALLYETILPVLRDADLHVEMSALTPEEVRAKLEKGRALLSELELNLDIDAARDLMIRLAAAVEKAGNKPHFSWLGPSWFSSSQNSDAAAHLIIIALEENRLDLSALLLHTAANDHGPIEKAARSFGLDPGLIIMLAKNVLKPALRVLHDQLAPLVKDITWNRGACYLCGSTATLAELQGNDQEKHLRCGSCGSDWRTRRLQCMHCGNEDHKTLRYLYAEDQRERMHVEACDRCHGYLKVISAFTPTPAEMLPVEDLATLHLDYIARERGYGRPEIR